MGATTEGNRLGPPPNQLLALLRARLGGRDIPTKVLTTLRVGIDTRHPNYLESTEAISGSLVLVSMRGHPTARSTGTCGLVTVNYVATAA